VTDRGLTTPEMAEIFSAQAFVVALARFEGTLALALADAGVAPLAAAEAVAVACAEPVPDADAIVAATWEEGTPIPALLAVIRERLSDETAGEWLHRGATTQDAVDTAHMLQAGAGLRALQTTTVDIATTLRRLVVDHRDQPQMGRTFLQHARPTTFGMRAASWLGAALTHLEALRSTGDALPLQLGGPVGDLAGMGVSGPEVVAALARRLDLRPPAIAWHSDRSTIWGLAAAVEGAVAAAAKIAMDVALLDQSDTAEVSVRGGASSSMSGKENPIDAIRALAAADVCHGAASILRRGRPHELDRALGAWHAEWVALPLLFRSASGALDGVARGLQSLTIDADRMTEIAGPGPVAADPRPIDAVLARFEHMVGDA
jgi:3-carboxy-cis,cis-muconate cycloisomerase